MRIAKGCVSWVAPPVVLSIILLVLSLYWNFLVFALFIPVLCLTIFFLIFFRDPERTIGPSIVAPADGRIREIKMDKKQAFISIFMEVNNVHVNRMPLEGTITDISYFPGKHLRAWKKESDLNERLRLTLSTALGTVQVVQIAGLIARRVYPYVQKGDRLQKGERIGIIRLGSRVDVILPSDNIKTITVKVGDPVLAGVTTIAEEKNKGEVSVP